MLCRELLLRAACSCVFELFLEQLLSVKIRVIAVGREEVGMGGGLDDVSFTQDNDLVSVLHGGSAVRNQNGRAAAHDAAQAGEDFFLSLRVHAGERVIKNENTGIANDRAGDGGPLFLSARKRDSALSNSAVVTRAEVFDVAMQAGDFSRVARTLGIVFEQAERDITPP